MPYAPKSPRLCLVCHVEADRVVLFPVYLMRPYTDQAGRKRTRSIPCRICAACARAALEAYAVSSGQIRAGLLEPSRPLAPRARVAGGRYASRAAMADASLAAGADG
jgi:hypothetical protein